MEVVAAHPRIAVLADDIYEHFVYDGGEFATPARVAPALRERVLTVNGVSKCYAMTGWRIGYAGGPAELIAAMATLQGQSTTNPSSISQAAAAAALRGPQDLLAQRRGELGERRDLIVTRLNAIPGLDCPTPAGAFYVYPNCAGLIGRQTPAGQVLRDDAGVAEYLLESAEVATVHGAAFGQSPHLRLCFARPRDMLEDACARIAGACAGLV